MSFIKKECFLPFLQDYSKTQHCLALNAYYISTLKLCFAQINYLEKATCVESYKQINTLAPYAFPYGQNLLKKKL